MNEKALKFSVSFPPNLAEAMDRHIGKMARSRYLQELAERDLKKAGVLEIDPVEGEITRLRELVATRGIGAVRLKLEELTHETILAEGGQ